MVVLNTLIPQIQHLRLPTQHISEWRGEVVALVQTLMDFQQWFLWRLQDDFNSKQRRSEYPTLADFADAYYLAQKGDNTLMDAYIDKCDAVKTKYSKV